MNDCFSSIDILLGGIGIRVHSQIPLQTGERAARFRADLRQPHCTIFVREMHTPRQLPAQRWGEDALLTYYRSGDYRYAAVKSGTQGNLMVTEYTPDFSDVNVYVNEKVFPNTVRTVEKLFQLFPMRQLLLHHNALLLHSSQIALGDRGILFTAPSGTGKSTQATLWQTHAGADIVCSDRTLIRLEDGEVNTYGYILDGSSPLSTNSRNSLGAIVALRQATENSVSQLRGAQALKVLMDQTVSDPWNEADFLKIQDLWVRVLRVHPVFLLACRPDRQSVECLMIEFIKKGVMKNGQY